MSGRHALAIILWLCGLWPVATQAATVMAGQQADRDAGVFVELEIEPGEPYVQSQVLVRIRLYRAVRTSRASLSEPRTKDGSAVVERLGDSTFESWHDGRRYIVLERRYALFPQRSGELHIEPVVFRGRVLAERRPLYADPYGSPRYDIYGPAARDVVRRTEPVVLNVRPAVARHGWLPARGATLEESWSDPAVFEVGKPITRTLTLAATQQTARFLPALDVTMPAGVRGYAGRVETENDIAEDGLIARRTERHTLIPQQAGEFTLPAIELRWFNTATGRAESLSLPERRIEVQPSSAEVAGAAPPAVPVSTAAPDATTAISQPDDGRNDWPWILLLLVAVSTAIITCRRIGLYPGLPDRRGASSALRQLREACAANDANAARAALSAWLRSEYGDDGKATPLSKLAGNHAASLGDAVAELDRMLYGPQTGHWQGERLWQAVLQADQRQPAGTGDGIESLAPLYRNTR